MSQADLQINRELRKIFVRHWIDLGKLTFRSSNGRVWIRGNLQRIGGVQEELNGPIVESMFQDVRQVRGVSNVSVELENWVLVLGRWQSLEKQKQKQAAFSVAPQPVDEVQDLSDTEKT